jgi:hypothetical protein
MIVTMKFLVSFLVTLCMLLPTYQIKLYLITEGNYLRKVFLILILLTYSRS